MKEMLVIGGGVHMIILVVFHVLFWRIFNWPETLIPLNRVNRSTIQVLNLSIIFIFGLFAYVSLVHTSELLNTKLGESILVLLSMLWLFRAIQQLIFYDRTHMASIGLTVFFLIGALLYGIPGFI
jgi:hypothetical protein